MCACVCVLSYMAVGTVLSNYADVLAILMRLRQHCCHPDLLARITSDLSTSPPTPCSSMAKTLWSE